MPSPKIVYLGGWGRSGSTLLCRALGEIDGWIAVGEMRSIWELGVIRNSTCGCGEPFHSCPFWKEVFERAFGGFDPGLARRMIADTGRLHTWQLLFRRHRLDRMLESELDSYLDALERLYRAVADVSGARVIVDSSKMPAYAYALDRLPGFDLHLVHLVRDPRACTYSWMKRRKDQPFGRMKSIGTVGNSVQWVQRNLAIRSAWQHRSDAYRLIRYEDFVEDPGTVLRGLAAFAGETEATLPFLESRSIHLGTSHLAAGNPNRFEVGTIKLREETAWRRGLSPWQNATVELLSAPWRKNYGYTRT